MVAFSRPWSRYDGGLFVQRYFFLTKDEVCFLLRWNDHQWCTRTHTQPLSCDGVLAHHWHGGGFTEEKDITSSFLWGESSITVLIQKTSHHGDHGDENATLPRRAVSHIMLRMQWIELNWIGGGSRKWPCMVDTQSLRCCCYKNVFLSKNKSKNKGLISADRRTKPTLMLTIPHSYKVVYNGFISSNAWNCDKIRCWTSKNEVYSNASHIGRAKQRRFPAWILT